jgi:hypothetical protein
MGIQNGGELLGPNDGTIKTKFVSTTVHFKDQLLRFERPKESSQRLGNRHIVFFRKRHHPRVSKAENKHVALERRALHHWINKERSRCLAICKYFHPAAVANQVLANIDK